ncbi:hypothetical protein HA466_0319980 [Hirschfeldia incana]|nr:hypothetical protein HA466_0319980 [Hirschfeldia incana]
MITTPVILTTRQDGEDKTNKRFTGTLRSQTPETAGNSITTHKPPSSPSSLVLQTSIEILRSHLPPFATSTPEEVTHTLESSCIGEHQTSKRRDLILYNFVFKETYYSIIT